MMPRLAIAALLAVAAASGCSSLQDNTISLVAQKPGLSRWPFKKTPPAQANEKVYLHDGPSTPPHGRETQLPSARGELFLHSLSVDLRERIEADLADATPEERQRLLAYLATVDRDRIPALLEARRKQAAAPAASESPKVISAAALGTPEFELAADEVADQRVEPASAHVVARSADLVQSAALDTVAVQPASAPVPRPRRNPLIEIQGVEFEDSTQAEVPKVTPATSMSLEQQIEAAPSITPGPVSPATPPSTNPLAKLKEWTTIRKADPNAVPTPAAQPTHPQPTQVPSDPLSLQGLSRRLRGAPKIETASLPLEDLPTIAGESPHLHEGLQRLIALMEAETARLKPGTSFAEREEYVRRHAELRMLLLMSRQPALALQAIPDVEPETQEFWTSLMWSMSSYFDNQSNVDPAERAATALDRLRAAEQHLQTTARLELKSLAFCDKIDGFGSYHPFEQDVFRAGQPVLLYAEVRNFKTDVTAAGRYRTSLKSTIEIVRSGVDGELIERRHFDSTEDQSRSPRTDYFHSYKLDLPLHLTPGTYSLKLTLEDELSGKIGASNIDFLVR
jgi:hypothetical protein